MEGKEEWKMLRSNKQFLDVAVSCSTSPNATAHQMPPPSGIQAPQVMRKAGSWSATSYQGAGIHHAIQSSNLEPQSVTSLTFWPLLYSQHSSPSSRTSADSANSSGRNCVHTQCQRSCLVDFFLARQITQQDWKCVLQGRITQTGDSQTHYTYYMEHSGVRRRRSRCQENGAVWALWEMMLCSQNKKPSSTLNPSECIYGINTSELLGISISSPLRFSY